jgi:hypothetical protein
MARCHQDSRQDGGVTSKKRLDKSDFIITLRF